MKLSVVIPLFNEKESLALLAEAVMKTARDSGFDLEMVFIDDGSTDGSFNVLKE